MARRSGPEPVIRDLAAGEPAAAARTGELGSEGGSFGELTQTARARRGANSEVRPRSSASLTLVLIAAVILLILLAVWFGSSLTEVSTPN